LEYREVAQAELRQFQNADAYCFGGSVAPAESPWAKRCMLPERTRAVFGADGQLKAALINFPFNVYMEGARVAMGGIGSVVSWPESRREGNVGLLMMRLLHEEHEKGVPLSSLYPFKQSFYRRYGWEVAAAWLEHEIPLEQLAPYRRSGGVIRRFAPGEADWRVLESLYASRFAGETGYVVRERAEHWDEFINPVWNPSAHHCFTALWLPAEGAAPEGYLLYRFAKTEQGERRLVIAELVARSAAAEQGLWGFVAQHDSQVQTVAHRTPRSFPLWHLVESTKDVKTELGSGWMLRLVDMAAAFACRPWHGAPDTAFAIGVADEHLPWNHGTFRLTFDAGRATLAPAPTDLPVIAADIRTWAQLYAGFIRPAQAAATGRLTCSDPAALLALEHATAGKEMWFCELF
jgi:predicted acetyltransferase